MILTILVPEFKVNYLLVGQDEVGGPPRVAVAEENGQVIAVRLYGGPDYDEDDSEGTEEGFSSDEDKQEVEN